jgi:hypothetical protein
MSKNVLIVGGTNGNEAQWTDQIGTMNEYWDPIMRESQYKIKFDSSNFDNYGRGRFNIFNELGNRVKNKYDVIIFEYCPLRLIIDECDGTDNMINKIEFLSNDQNPVTIIPFRWSDDRKYYFNGIKFLNHKYSDPSDHYNYDYYDCVMAICNSALSKGYDIYGNISWFDINKTLFPDINLHCTKNNFHKDKFIIITKNNLNLSKLNTL